VIVHLIPDNPLVRIKHGAVAATLCSDGTAVGGGHISFILDNNFENIDPAFELTAGTEMIFWYAPIHWADIGEDNLIVYAALQPIGEFRKDLLGRLGPKALADWESHLSSQLETGGYDLDNYGDADVNVITN
jgi:hypothetical protein